MLAGAGIQVQTIRPLASGDDSDTYLCDNFYVMKVPKRELVKKSQALEFQLYHSLKSYDLSCQIPMVVYRGEDFNLMTYIRGESLNNTDYHQLNELEKECLASDEAAFLKQLHSIPISVFHSIYSSIKLDTKDRFLQDRKMLLEILEAEHLLTSNLATFLENLYDKLLHMEFLFTYKPCLVHNDFSANNMIFRNHRLAGVIDFGDAVIGDPDNDFLCLLDNSTDDFGKDFGRKVLRYYGHPHPELAERKAEINDAYWPIQQILLGYSQKDSQRFQEGIQNLDRIVLPD